MYDELVLALKHCAKRSVCNGCPRCGKHIKNCPSELYCDAADAIERLSRECNVLYAMLGTHPDPRGELGDPGILREPPKEEA